MIVRCTKFNCHFYREIKIIPKLLISLIVITVSCNNIGECQNYYGFSPATILALGQGFSRSDLSQAKPRAISYKIHKTSEGAVVTTFSEVAVQNSKALKEALKIDLKIDASYLIFQGGSTFSYDQSIVGSSNSVTFVITANTEYGQLTMDNPKLNEDAQRYITEGRIKDFENIYGTQYVLMERRGATVSAIITISEADYDLSSKIGVDLHGKAGYGPISAESKTSFQKAMQQAGKEGRLTIEVVSSGGDGFGSLSELVKSLSFDADALNKIHSALGEYIKTFSFDNSAPIGFHTAPMTNFEYQPLAKPQSPIVAPPISNDFWTESKEDEFEDITNKYREIYAKYKYAKMILNGDDPQSSIMSKEQKEKLQSGLLVYQEYMDKLETAHNSCKTDPNYKCRLPIQTVPEDILPALPSLPSFYWARGSKASGSYYDKGSSYTIIQDLEKQTSKKNNGNTVVEESFIFNSGTYLLVSGYKILGIDIYFENKNTGELVLIKSYKIEGGQNNIAFTTWDDLNEKYTFCLDCEIQKLFDKKMIMASGVFRIVIKDYFGRLQKANIATAIWDNNGTNNKLRIGFLHRTNLN